MWFYIHVVLQVEVTGLNTVMVQNLSSLSRYRVSVQSHYPQGLSAALIGNITTCTSLKNRLVFCASDFLYVTSVPVFHSKTFTTNSSLRCSKSAFPVGSKGD